MKQAIQVQDTTEEYAEAYGSYKAKSKALYTERKKLRNDVQIHRGGREFTKLQAAEAALAENENSIRLLDDEWKQTERRILTAEYKQKDQLLAALDSEIDATDEKILEAMWVAYGLVIEHVSLEEKRLQLLGRLSKAAKRFGAGEDVYIPKGGLPGVRLGVKYSGNTTETTAAIFADTARRMVIKSIGQSDCPSLAEFRREE